jgi:hypothetical protein
MFGSKFCFGPSLFEIGYTLEHCQSPSIVAALKECCVGTNSFGNWSIISSRILHLASQTYICIRRAAKKMVQISDRRYSFPLSGGGRSPKTFDQHGQHHTSDEQRCRKETESKTRNRRSSEPALTPYNGSQDSSFLPSTMPALGRVLSTKNHGEGMLAPKSSHRLRHDALCSLYKNKHDFINEDETRVHNSVMFQARFDEESTSIQARLDAISEGETRFTPDSSRSSDLSSSCASAPAIFGESSVGDKINNLSTPSRGEGRSNDSFPSALDYQQQQARQYELETLRSDILANRATLLTKWDAENAALLR